MSTRRDLMLSLNRVYALGWISRRKCRRSLERSLSTQCAKVALPWLRIWIHIATNLSGRGFQPRLRHLQKYCAFLE
jgi:hypothetical protein